MAKILAVKVENEFYDRVWAEVVKVPRRSLSEWLRPVIEKELPAPKAKPKEKAKA